MNPPASATVYFLPIRPDETDPALAARLAAEFDRHDWIGQIVAGKDFVAIKTHFGEEGTKGYVRPVHFVPVGERVRAAGGLPFLTDTQTLYSGRRKNAVEHLILAEEHGFSLAKTGIPLVMADGLLGDEEVTVPIAGKLYRKVAIASLIAKAQALVVVSHFTGHLGTGFGAALKNLGMGCASRRGKMAQHSTAKPKVKGKKCTRCGQCVRWCPETAITMEENAALIDQKKCIGCGECLAVCRFDAVGYNWSATYEELQRKVAEHALGVVTGKEKKLLCLNFLTRISKDCDCMAGFTSLAPDIGVVIGNDPVAVDTASLDLVEARLGRPLGEVAYDIPTRVQLDHAQEIGLGLQRYRLETIGG